MYPNPQSSDPDILMSAPDIPDVPDISAAPPRAFDTPFTGPSGAAGFLKALPRHSPQSILGGRQLRPPPTIASNRRRRGIDPTIDSPDAVSRESAQARARRSSPAVRRFGNRPPLINQTTSRAPNLRSDEVVENLAAPLV